MAQVGRPLKFESVDMILPAIEEYFESTPEEEWTITGLALALDFTSRRQLIEYAERPEFHNTIKKAKLQVELAYEKSLRKYGRSGDIFALKNFDWSDKSETDITTKGEALNTGNLDAGAINARLDALINATKAGADKPAGSQE